jgi:hypothetical protein
MSAARFFQLGAFLLLVLCELSHAANSRAKAQSPLEALFSFDSIQIGRATVADVFSFYGVSPIQVMEAGSEWQAVGGSASFEHFFCYRLASGKSSHRARWFLVFDYLPLATNTGEPIAEHKNIITGYGLTTARLGGKCKEIKLRLSDIQWPSSWGYFHTFNSQKLENLTSKKTNEALQLADYSHQHDEFATLDVTRQQYTFSADAKGSRIDSARVEYQVQRKTGNLEMLRVQAWPRRN